MYSIPMSPRQPHKGRGTAANPDGRFEPYRREAEHDGWDLDAEPDPAPATVLLPDRAKTVITRNESPDVPFDYSVNVYRGCEHGCPYCLSGDTRILMADGRHKALEDIQVGERIIGTQRQGWYRRFVETEVRAHWQTTKPAYRITLEDGTSIVASGDHRFLTERGWKYVTGSEWGYKRRPHLTPNNKLMGLGSFTAPPSQSQSYRIGYLSGMIRGDALLASYSYMRAGRAHGNQHQFRLALTDREALFRTRAFLRNEGIETFLFEFQKAANGTRPLQAIRNSSRQAVQHIKELIKWPDFLDREWSRGFLAGIFDAEGCFSGSYIRITNSDQEIVRRVTEALDEFHFNYIVEEAARPIGKDLMIIRLRGGLSELLRFLQFTDVAITRKRRISRIALKSQNRLGVRAIKKLGFTIPMFDITSGTGDFIANGVVAHNCYARPSHSYLGLSPGLDFETRIFYKPDVARRLEAELAKPGYVCKPISLGANTDPYQPAEKNLRVTRSVLEVLARCRHPVTLVTKSAMVRRDLDLLADLAGDGLASVAVSLTSLDNELKRTLEPRTAGPRARLKNMLRLREAGVPVTALIAPVIPAVNEPELEDLVSAAADHGATRAGYVLLRLPHEVKDLFREWLDTHHPLRAEHVMSLIRQSRGGRDNDPRFGHRMRGQGPFAELINKRFHAACRRHGLNRDPMPELDTSQFRPPELHGQGRLF